MNQETKTIPMNIAVSNQILSTEMDAGAESKFMHLWTDMLSKTLRYLTDDLVPKTITGFADYLFRQNAILSRVNLSHVRQIGAETFFECGITELSMPELQMAGPRSLACNPFSEVVLPSLTSVENYVFFGCLNLESVDLPSAQSLGYYCFSGCELLSTLILRNAQMVELTGSSQFFGTKIEEGTGLIYVPDDLIETYQTSPMWSAYSGQFRPLSELKT